MSTSAFFQALEPHSWLPPAQPWHGASESLIVAADHPWITPAEQTGLTETPDYSASIAWLEKLCAASQWLTMHEFGKSAEGRPLMLVIASKETAHTPEALRVGGKPTLLVQAGIHPGEIEGKDAGFMLLRDIAFGPRAELLDEANLLLIPVLNPDGHERSSLWSRPNQRGPLRMGWRTTAQNLNLNRDYMKADAPEMRALLKLFNDWPVELYLDVHTTDGLDFQYDITYAYHGRQGTPSWSPQINAWLDQSLSPAVYTALHAQHHLPLNLYVQPVSKRTLQLGLRESQMPPRFSLGYGDLRHIPSVLIETHSLKPYRQRVLATHVFIEAALRHLSKDAKALRAAIAADCSSRPAEVILTWADGGPKRELDFQGMDFENYTSPASGGQEVRWLSKPREYPDLPIFTDKAGLAAKRPANYWVPVTKPQVIELLRLHGIEFELIPEPREVEVTLHRLVLPQSMPAAESRFPVKIEKTIPERRKQLFPAGSARISTDQPLGDLAVHLLEPLAADSLLHWGFFNEVLHRTEYIEGYIIAPLAEKMLQADGKLKADFEAQLAADPSFAQAPEARLHWFYQRSPFYDDRHLLYPVGFNQE
ncbi:MAG: M14 family metallopeptidase [Verrucomicrobiaceae bacterium]|nr:M14 family metallopeptidase [Verrucomicrobiaceae bacterium]